MIKMLGENFMEGAWFWIAPIARGWETTTAVGYRGYVQIWNWTSLKLIGSYSMCRQSRYLWSDLGFGWVYPCQPANLNKYLMEINSYLTDNSDIHKQQIENNHPKNVFQRVCLMWFTECRLSTGHSWGLALVSSLLTGLHWAALGTDPAH